MFIKCFQLTLTLHSCKGPEHKHEMYIFFSFWRVREAQWFPNKAFQHQPEDSLKCKFLLQNRFSHLESVLGLSYLCSLAAFLKGWCWCRKTEVQHKGLTGLCDSPPAQPSLGEGGNKETQGERSCLVSASLHPLSKQEKVCVGVCVHVHVCMPHTFSAFILLWDERSHWPVITRALSAQPPRWDSKCAGTYVVSWADTQVLLLVR